MRLAGVVAQVGDRVGAGAATTASVPARRSHRLHFGAGQLRLPRQVTQREQCVHRVVRPNRRVLPVGAERPEHLHRAGGLVGHGRAQPGLLERLRHMHVRISEPIGHDSPKSLQFSKIR